MRCGCEEEKGTDCILPASFRGYGQCRRSGGSSTDSVCRFVGSTSLYNGSLLLHPPCTCYIWTWMEEKGQVLCSAIPCSSRPLWVALPSAGWGQNSPTEENQTQKHHQQDHSILCLPPLQGMKFQKRVYIFIELDGGLCYNVDIKGQEDQPLQCRSGEGLSPAYLRMLFPQAQWL